MIKKIVRLLLLALVLWFAGGVIYYMAAEQKLQEQLTPALGSDYSVKLELFDDWFLQNETRTARVTITAKTGAPRSASTTVVVGGRIFPNTVNLGNTGSLRRLIGDLVDLIGTESRAERARHGIDESIIED